MKNQKLNFVSMSASRITFFRILFVVITVSHTTSAFTQVEGNGASLNSALVVDTSDYVPAFYPNAFDFNLMIASSKGYTSEIDRLIGLGADINAETDEGATPIIFAVSNGNLETVKALLKHKPKLNEVASGSETPLLIAVKNMNIEISEALIRAGADINFQDRYGATPIHYSAIYGYLEITDLLLYYEASTELKSYEGTTPLLASIWAGYQDVADLLIQNGANMEARDNDGFTPFLMAAYTGDTLIMDILYKYGVNIYSTNYAKHDALTLSIINDNIGATNYLLRIGNQWSSSVNDAINPYKVTTKYRRKDMADILINHNVPGQVKHEIDQVAFAVSSRFSINDIYTGFSIAFKEPYLNAGFIAGCDTKLWYTKVLEKNSEHLFYQYRTKGSVVYGGLFKDFPLTNHPVKRNFFLSTSLLAGYSFGNILKGTLQTPDNRFMVIPAVSFKVIGRKLSLSMGLEYLNSEYYKVGPIWMRIGCSYTNFFDKIRLKDKKIKWY